MTIHTIRLLLALCAAVVASVVPLDAKQQEPEPEEWPDTMAALPAVEEVPGFDKVKVREDPDASAVTATRARDGAELHILSWVFPTAEKAHEVMPRMILVTYGEGNGHQVEVGPGGSIVGQEMWVPRYKSSTTFRSMYTFAVRDGRSVLLMYFMLPYEKDENGERIKDEHGNDVKPLVTPEDLKLIEDQAALCLSKLSKMGYTSKSKE